MDLEQMSATFFRGMEKLREEIRQGAAEHEQGMARLREAQEKTGQQIQELREAQRQTDAQQRHTDEQIQELRAAQALAAAESEQKMEKLRKTLESVTKQLGSIGAHMGDFAEELFYQGFLESRMLGGLRYDSVERNVHEAEGRGEYDILLLNGHATALIEVKYKAHPSDIADLVVRKVANFRKHYSEYAKHKLYLGLATTITYGDLIAQAKEAGIYLLTQKGGHVELLSSEVRAF